MQRIMDAVIIAGVSGGLLGAIIATGYWIAERIRGPVADGDEASEEPPPMAMYPRPLTRTEMIERLQSIADDPESSEADRDGALERLRLFDKYTR